MSNPDACDFDFGLEELMRCALRCADSRAPKSLRSPHR
jgi:hypothetical protein